jgi:hypothetical protein
LLGTLTRSTLSGGSRMAFLDDDILTSVPSQLRVVRAIAQIALLERRRDWEEWTFKSRFQTRFRAPAQNSRLEIPPRSRGDKRMLRLAGTSVCGAPAYLSFSQIG